MSSIIPHKTARAKTKVNKKANDDTMPAEPSGSILAMIPKTCPKPQPMGAATATDIDAKAAPELGRPLSTRPLRTLSC